jgi:hypothetical protein
MTISDREKRTIRIALIVVVAYLGLFYGFRGWNVIDAERRQYREQLAEAEQLNHELRTHENNLIRLERLKQTLGVNPARLSRDTVVAEANAAIQAAAREGGIELGPMREGPGSQASGELATMDLEGTGQVSAILTLLQRVETLGFPLIVESAQFTPDSSRPGSVKVNLRIAILDFERWANQEDDRDV